MKKNDRNSTSPRSSIKKTMEEIKKKRTYMSVFTTFYDTELGSTPDTVKKIDSQQITRCVFEILAHLVRNKDFEKDRKKKNISVDSSSSSNRNKSVDKIKPFFMDIEIHSNIVDVKMIETLKNIYTIRDFDKEVENKKDLHSEVKTFMKNVKFINCVLDDKEKKSKWRFKWKIDINDLRFIWIWNSHMKGSWKEIKLSNKHNHFQHQRKSPTISKKMNNGDQKNSKNDILEIDNGPCNFFKVLKLIFDVDNKKRSKKIYDFVNDFYANDTLSNIMNETSLCALMVSEKERNKQREKIDDDILCLKFRMNLQKHDPSCVIETPFFYADINNDTIKKWAISISNRNRNRKIHSSSSSSSDINVDNSDVKKFLPYDPLEDNENHVKKTKRKDGRRRKNKKIVKKKKRDFKVTYNLSLGIDGVDYEDNICDASISSGNFGKYSKEQYISKCMKIINHSKRLSNRKKKTINTTLLAKKISYDLSGSHKVGQTISKSISTQNKKICIISMGDVYFLDLLLILGPLMNVEESIIKDKCMEKLSNNVMTEEINENEFNDYRESINKKNNTGKEKTPKSDKNLPPLPIPITPKIKKINTKFSEKVKQEYLEKLPSNFGMVSLRNFYMSLLTSCNLDKILSIKKYNADTNQKRMPVSRGNRKIKKEMNYVNMKVVKQEVLDKAKVIFDCTRFGEPGGPPEWSNISPIECRDIREFENENALISHSQPIVSSSSSSSSPSLSLSNKRKVISSNNHSIPKKKQKNNITTSNTKKEIEDVKYLLEIKKELDSIILSKIENIEKTISK